MVDVPEQHEPGQRCRLPAEGHRIDDSSWPVLLVIHGLGAPGVRLAGTVMVTLAGRSCGVPTGEP